ncbi:MAG: hypothetical protein NC433_07310 [Clostridiales bacterium]|nr:hypothetical protein [Clostridiales bacterium]
MKKSNFVALVLGTVGGVCFSLGMCMALLSEWNMRTEGIVCGAVGLVILLATVGIWRKMEGKEPIKPSKKTIGGTLVSVFGALLLGVGMCLCMVFGQMIIGIVVGVIGIVVLLMLIPILKGLK